MDLFDHCGKLEFYKADYLLFPHQIFDLFCTSSNCLPNVFLLLMFELFAYDSGKYRMHDKSMIYSSLLFLDHKQIFTVVDNIQSSAVNNKHSSSLQARYINISSLTLRLWTMVDKTAHREKKVHVLTMRCCIDSYGTVVPLPPQKSRNTSSSYPRRTRPSSHMYRMCCSSCKCALCTACIILHKPPSACTSETSWNFTLSKKVA